MHRHKQLKNLPTSKHLCVNFVLIVLALFLQGKTRGDAISTDEIPIEERVRSAVNKIKSIKIRQNTANWTRSVRLILEDDKTFLADYLLPIFGSEDLNSSAFQLRRNKPWPVQDEHKFVEENFKDEYLYLFAVAEVPLNKSIFIEGVKFTVADLLQNSLMEFRLDSQKIGRSLYAYLYYLSSSQIKWENKFGEKLELYDLVLGITKKDVAECSFYDLQAISLLASTDKWLNNRRLKKLTPKVSQKIQAYLKMLKEKQQYEGSLPCLLKTDEYNCYMRYLIAQKIFNTSNNLKILLLFSDAKALEENWCYASVQFLAEAIDKYLVTDIGGYQKTSELAEFYSICYSVETLSLWQERRFR